MKILALDLATQTGWASEAGGIVTSGTISFKAKGKEGKGFRFMKFQSWLWEIISVEKPDRVFFEDVKNHAGVLAAHAYGGYLAMMQAALDSRGITYRGIGVGQIKKVATGKGNASKDEMVEAAKARWPDQDITDNNVADALWILEAGKRL